MNWLKLPQPIIALAAMDGVSDTVFRQICRQWGADLVFTEFIHSTGLIRSKKYRDPILKYSENERPVVVQIYGNNPEDFYQAALFVLELGFDGVDINMGCPSKSVAGHGSGCALMRDPALATQIVQNVIKARDEFIHNKNIVKEIPITVKMRIGYDDIIAPEFAQVLEDAGAEGLIVHGRTLKMGYSGFAKWDVIGNVVKAVKIRVIGNGDVKTADDVRRAIDLGCAGVTIGRATFGNPFIFYEIKKQLGLSLPTIKQHSDILSNVNSENIFHQSLKQENLEIDLPQRLETYLQHAQIAYDEYGERGLIESRKHISGYVRSFDGASELRQKLIFAKSISEIQYIISTIK